MSEPPWLSPETIRAMQALAAQAQEQMDRVIGPVLRAFELARESLERISRTLAESPAMREFARTQTQVQKQLDTLVRSEAFVRFVEFVREAEPPKWPDGRSAAVIELIERTGWPLVWVPDEGTVWPSSMPRATRSSKLCASRRAPPSSKHVADARTT